MTQQAMQTVMVTGLDDAGPGDILGAVGGDTSVDPDSIGAIDIQGSYAFLEVPETAAATLVEELEMIGQSEVALATVDDSVQDRFQDMQAYVSRYERLVEMEREEEMRRHEESIRKLSGREREDRGKAILHLRGRDEGEGLGGHLVKFMRQRKGEQLPETEISVGDLVMLSKNDPLRDDNPTGTVTEKTAYSITVAFDEKPPGFVYGKGLRMDLYVNDITYQRMKDALQRLPALDQTQSHIRDTVIGLDEPAEREKAEIDGWHNPGLNDSQKEAVKYALGADDIRLIHGPPGTGKTTTVIEVIEQEVDAGKSVLATAASNMAVDNMLEFLLAQGVDAVRVGHPARVTPQLREHTLDNLVTDNEKYQQAEELREEAFDLQEEQDDLTHPSGRYRRGMSNKQIKELAEQGRGSRGVSPDKIQEMAEWLELQDEIDELFEEADRLRDAAVQEIIDAADVVCTTNSTAGSDLLDGATFDVLVIDEATQATEPSCLIPMVHAETVVMAGDHRQLPPTVKNQDAAEHGLERTLFERLAEKYGDTHGITSLLDTQYRMHRDIMQFSSQAFYDGALQADDAVRDHTLADLAFDLDAVTPDWQDALDPDDPVVFLDTADMDAPERSREGSSSKENPEEARIVTELTANLLDAGIAPEDIGVISPYDDQVDLLRQRIDDEDLEVKTVDGFQGREKEVIVVSLVRSNQQNVIGFLQDVRRLNVALTRAKRKLIVVGDSDTITAHGTYRQFVDFVDENGLHITL